MEVDCHRYKDITTMKVNMKDKDWSLNLEDAFYEENPAEIVKECVIAVQQTKLSCYVNLVTPGNYGDPRERLIPELVEEFKLASIKTDRIEYIDQCGCG